MDDRMSLMIKCIAVLFIFGVFYSVYIVESWYQRESSLRARNQMEPNHFEPIHVLPHAIIIGAFKCGTYALKRMMEDIYPNVHAFRGEPRFFSHHYGQGIESYKRSLPRMESPEISTIFCERKSSIKNLQRFS